MSERREVKAPEKVDIQMTPMIDIVFQLMAFFLMTFKVATVEGDFDLRLPKAERSTVPEGLRDLIAVRLHAAPDGELAALRIEAGAPLPGRDAPQAFRELREHLARKSSAARAAGQEEPEVELDADYTLRYEHIVGAIEAVRGPTEEAAGKPTRRVRFAPRRE